MPFHEEEIGMEATNIKHKGWVYGYIPIQSSLDNFRVKNNLIYITALSMIPKWIAL